jgi:hypothetical protein
VGLDDGAVAAAEQQPVDDDDVGVGVGVGASSSSCWPKWLAPVAMDGIVTETNRPGLA